MPNGKRYSIEVDDEVLSAARTIAQKEDRTVANVLKLLIPLGVRAYEHLGMTLKQTGEALDNPAPRFTAPLITPGAPGVPYAAPPVPAMPHDPRAYEETDPGYTEEELREMLARRQTGG